MREQIMKVLGWLLGLENTQSIGDSHFEFGAAWVHDMPLVLLLGCLLLVAISVVFYLRYEGTRHGKARAVLAIFRAAALCLLLLFLAEPVLHFTEVSQKLPGLWLVFDGTDSMGISDESAEQPADKQADKPAGKALSQCTRIEGVKALLEKQDGEILKQLGKDFRVQAFLFDGPQGARSLELSEGGKPGLDGKHLAQQLTTNGKVTALGAALADLAKRNAAANPGGVVVFSDFDQNAGQPPMEAARQIGAPIYTVGVGAVTAVNVGVEVQAEPYVTKDERTTVTVLLKQQGLEGKKVQVTLSAEPIGSASGTPGARVQVAAKEVRLTGPSQTVEFPYSPQKAGRFWLVADAELMADEGPVPHQAVSENNHARREIIVLDDFLRLLYVEYEPTWEWRFIKEVFYRDRLVGMKGFRTFLYSSDPRVRQVNQMFLPSLSPSRTEFFAHDVIFLGDVPAGMLSSRFCEMVKEFVGDFGGALVVISGPRFGPEQLAETPLGEMLPVKVEAGARFDDRQPFRLRLTPMAGEYKFMQLGSGDSPAEMQRTWDNMGLIPWFQPVSRKDPQATVLAEHPTLTCADGKEHQPLIAIRPYGRGEVVYLGFNETWRLRRTCGERYFRQFWAQMIQRLALNHALGAEKRFVVRTDRDHYQVDEPVTVTVEAFNKQFEPLGENDLLSQQLHGELLVPAEGNSEGGSPQPLSLTQLRKGVFETRFTVFASGEHRVRVTDPIENKQVEWRFQVLGTPVERQRATRNVALQHALAQETGGKTCDLKDAESLLRKIHENPRMETSVKSVSLVSTWLTFGLLVLLLLAEWLMCKWVNLT